MSKNDIVKAWEQDVTIPTYETAKADKNPMFLEKRVYQGSSGKVYPHPVTEAISNEKTDKIYKAVFLENEYLQIMILPEIGGRIQRALDKTNGYDFVYYNRVIKPALVGLAGPWISGGIEFNWPQHHRPSTFDPVDYKIVENSDGSKTVWVGEIEKMYHTKGMAGFTLYPGKAYLEIKGQLYNPTDLEKTFLWWANPAVAVNDDTQSIFPPDVHAVMDHGKRDVSRFPIATGTYYKMDYSAGVDISRYKNIPVPTSYMAYHSDFDFIGNYDYGKKAGLLHVADHHISPGKKQWTWGCGDFGKAWDRNLTDEDGPYIELMTGVYTDNQPDFSFIAPYEEKRFVQYFMPYKNIGAVKNATRDAMVNLEFENQNAAVHVYVTSSHDSLKINVKGKRQTYVNKIVKLSPDTSFFEKFETDEKETDITVSVIDENGKILVSYTPLEKTIEKIPEPAKPALAPEEISSCEDLFLTAVHLEQYHHATYDPELYYLEGLKREPTDIRLNNGYGKLLFKKGLFEKSEAHFRTAIKKLTWKNPNPYDGEPYYNLGLALRMQGRYEESFDAFYKSAWNSAQQDGAYYQLAALSARKGDLLQALNFIDISLSRNVHNLKARNLKTSVLRKIGKIEEAKGYAQETNTIDPLDFGAMYELYAISKDEDILSELTNLMRGDTHNYIELSLNYAVAGMYNDAADVLNLLPNTTDPMMHYYLAFYQQSDNLNILETAAKCSGDYCFPNRLEDIIVLKYAISKNPSDSKAMYYLGNLLYDKGQHHEAIRYWENSRSLDDAFSIVHRNLALAYFNKEHNAEKALVSMTKAFECAPSDARILLELDQLLKRMNTPVEKRLNQLSRYENLVKTRDDLYTEYITLLNLTSQYEKALSAMNSHIFHPWEGGEGKITSQYKTANIELAKKAILNKEYERGITLLNNALIYPYNLGEGKLAGAQENDIYYFLGCAYEGLGNKDAAKDAFMRASAGGSDLGSAMYYNDQPPEMFFYQALSSAKLGDEKSAKGKFNKLVDYAEQHIYDKVSIDYFAVSLPDFLIFDTDLTEKNYIHCCYLMGLGLYGLGKIKESEKMFSNGLEKDLSHQGILTHLKLMYTDLLIHY
ncbi:MAG: DUF5107 domain-containing protein [Clostridia bacterium]|nr:DUF5107 domain-containing protein [Clostridia bacterium]